MREIKFRYYYKNKYTKEIVSKIRDIATIEDTEFEVINFENEHLELLDRCQYTGLKDKNNKEIYKGDIVKTKINKYKYEYFEIAYYKQAFALRNKKGHKEYLCNLACFDCLEVVGNIFENPELLKN